MCVRVQRLFFSPYSSFVLAVAIADEQVFSVFNLSFAAAVVNVVVGIALICSFVLDAVPWNLINH